MGTLFYCNECFAMVKPVVKKKKPVVRCVALDCDGRQCRNAATKSVEYHGNHELYGYHPGQGKGCTWVKIKVCREHFDGINN
jgi:hypothetical protein